MVSRHDTKSPPDAFSSCKPFFWLHIKKAGGSSIRKALSRYYVSIERRKVRPLSSVQPHERNDWINNFRQDFGPYDFKRMQFARDKVYSSGEIRQLYVFTFVRNPYDRAVSMWRYLDKNTFSLNNLRLSFHRARFGDFLKAIPSFWEKKQADRHKATHTAPIAPDITDRDGVTLLVDFIGRIERFQEDFDRVTSHLGIPRIKMPRKNRRRRLPVPYTAYYNKKNRRLVEELYRKDIELLEYSFE
ncbi:MAG: hypothetical protein GF350_13080 [Chitinivibrionales bacterium]|nr:hypothetical protein [Chitinivibrionales bacterium]